MLEDAFRSVIREIVREEVARQIGTASVGHAPEPERVNPKDVERIFGIPTGSLANMRSKGLGPAYAKAGRAVVYKRSDVEAWLNAGRVRTASQRD